MGNEIDRITLHEDNREIWSLRGDFNKSLTIGILVAGKILIKSDNSIRIEAYKNNKNIPIIR